MPLKSAQVPSYTAVLWAVLFCGTEANTFSLGWGTPFPWPAALVHHISMHHIFMMYSVQFNKLIIAFNFICLLSYDGELLNHRTLHSHLNILIASSRIWHSIRLFSSNCTVPHSQSVPSTGVPSNYTASCKLSPPWEDNDGLEPNQGGKIRWAFCGGLTILFIIQLILFFTHTCAMHCTRLGWADHECEPDWCHSWKVRVEVKWRIRTQKDMLTSVSILHISDIKVTAARSLCIVHSPLHAWRVEKHMGALSHNTLSELWRG